MRVSGRLRGMFAAVCALTWLGSCSFAPKYTPPFMPIPANYKESGTWVAAKPSLPTLTKQHPWWMLYHDPVLNALEDKVTCGNEQIKVALAHFQEARAIAESTRSQLYPQILGQGSGSKQQNSTTLGDTTAGPLVIYSTFILNSSVNYEVDAWGRIRNAVKATDSLARASDYDVAAINVSMHAEMAADYFELRGDDAAQMVLDSTVIAYTKALYLTRQLHQGGVASAIDVDQAMTQLENAKTMALDLRLRRAQLEHAMAVLTGEFPESFHVSPNTNPIHPVLISPDLPSTLLQQRPDIAAAERRVFAANASIGVARAAFFPVFNLNGLIGYKSRNLSNLLSTPNLIWSLGPPTGLALLQPEISQVIFDGYHLDALLRLAKAKYFDAVSAYRQTVLTAVQQVDDSLVAIRRLNQESKTQAAATNAAIRALEQANLRYRGGIATYLDVVITENQALQAKLALINIHTRRQLASVQLIKALGGGWL